MYSLLGMVRETNDVGVSDWGLLGSGLCGLQIKGRVSSTSIRSCSSSSRKKNKTRGGHWKHSTLATQKLVKWQKQQKQRKMRDQSMLSPSFPRFTASINVSKWRRKTGIQKKTGDLWWGKGKEEKIGQWSGKEKNKVWLLAIDNNKKIRQERRKVLLLLGTRYMGSKNNTFFNPTILAWPSSSCEIKYAMMIFEPSVYLTLQSPAFSQVSFPNVSGEWDNEPWIWSHCCSTHLPQFTVWLSSLLLSTPILFRGPYLKWLLLALNPLTSVSSLQAFPLHSHNRKEKIWNF